MKKKKRKRKMKKLSFIAQFKIELLCLLSVKEIQLQDPPTKNASLS